MSIYKFWSYYLFRDILSCISYLYFLVWSAGVTGICHRPLLIDVLLYCALFGKDAVEVLKF